MLGRVLHKARVGNEEHLYLFSETGLVVDVQATCPPLKRPTQLIVTQVPTSSIRYSRIRSWGSSEPLPESVW